MFLSSCDTMVVMSDMTACGSVIFAKNSDRQVNEPLSVRYIPAAIHQPHSKVKTTFLEIDQVEKTYACVLFSPTNIFGAEMGFNAHGLVIGNEALFTKIPSNDIGLTGMDLVRLVLERCSTSEQGKNTIIELLKAHGQGGNCGFSTPFYYQNSFLIADADEAWLMEAVGREYAAKRIRTGIRTISNQISFTRRDTFDECSENLIQQAINNGWCQSIDDFDFHRCYSGFSYYPRELFNGLVRTKFACSAQRQCRAQQYLDSPSRPITINDVFRTLRDHQLSSESPADGLTKMDLCMHAGFGPVRFSQTTGSLVSILPQKSQNQLPTHFATCSSLPCLSIYKPIWLSSTSVAPSFLVLPSSSVTEAPLTYASNNLWWKSEVINRNLMKFYQQLIEIIRSERDSVEQDIITQASVFVSNDIDPEQRNQFSLQCFEQSDELANRWFDRVQSLALQNSSEYSLWNEITWESYRTSAGIPSNLLSYPKADRAWQWARMIVTAITATASSWVLMASITRWSKDSSLFRIPLLVSLVLVSMVPAYGWFRHRIHNPRTQPLSLPRLNFV